MKSNDELSETIKISEKIVEMDRIDFFLFI